MDISGSWDSGSVFDYAEKPKTPFPVERLGRLIAAFNRRLEKNCFYCGVKMGKPKWMADHKLRATARTREHVIPECRGGRYIENNVVRACWSCNDAKGPMTLEEFRRACWGGRPFYFETVMGVTPRDVFSEVAGPSSQGPL